VRDFGRFWFRVTACHVVTYFFAGLAAYSLFGYNALFQSEAFACYMKPIASKWVAAGPALQVIRGLILALVLYPFREVFLSTPRGWLKLAGLLVGLSVLSAAGAAPGSVEGVIYTRVPWFQQLQGLPEVIVQNFALAALLVAWYRNPRKAWGIVMGVLLALVLAMCVAGALIPRPEAYR
jgi:hypothetical protein